MCYLMSEATSFAPSPCCISAIKSGGGSGYGSAINNNNTNLFNGVWKTDADGEKIEMHPVQNGNHVTGTYNFQNGRLEGTIIGNVLRFKWTQDNVKGAGRFILSGDGTSLSGHWSYTNDPDIRRVDWYGLRK
jgi:hypothetical protein